LTPNISTDMLKGLPSSLSHVVTRFWSVSA
jgi:hypothetical protein